ncbi:MAG TPA: hypothetical protein VL261_06160 [Nitrospira sp.]|nr:hypothetical protein [Nitrospira sp.]
MSIEIPGLGTGHEHGGLAAGTQAAATGDWTGETHGGKTEFNAKGAVGGYGFHEVYIYHRQE